MAWKFVTEVLSLLYLENITSQQSSPGVQKSISISLRLKVTVHWNHCKNCKHYILDSSISDSQTIEAEFLCNWTTEVISNLTWNQQQECILLNYSRIWKSYSKSRKSNIACGTSGLKPECQTRYISTEGGYEHKARIEKKRKDSRLVLLITLRACVSCIALRRVPTTDSACWEGCRSNWAVTNHFTGKENFQWFLRALCHRHK